MIRGTREEQLRYMREYYRANITRLYPASVERVRAYRARKARQAKVIEGLLTTMDRFEYGRRCEAVREELRMEKRW